MSKLKYIGWILVALGWMSLILATFIGSRVDVLYSIAPVLCLVGGFLLFGKEMWGVVFASAVAIAFWFWIEALGLSLNNETFLRTNTLFFRVILIMVAFALFLLMYHVLPGAFSRVFLGISTLLRRKGVLTAILSFVVAYLAMLSLFGLFYASAYAWIGTDCFRAPRELSLIDFFYFSSVTATTLGYGDIHPMNSFVCMLTMVQVLVSVIFISLYLGAVVSLLAASDKER